MANLGEPAWAQIGEQRTLVDLIALVRVLLAQSVFLRHRRDYGADDQAVQSEPVNDAMQLAFEKKIAPFDQHSVHLASRKRRQRKNSRLGLILAPWAGGEAREQDLRWARKADGEYAMPANVVIRSVPRAADKAIVIVPSQRHRHVFWRKIRSPVALSAADDDQRKHAEDTVPDRSTDIQRY